VDETAFDLRGHALFRDAVPGVVRSLFHGGSSSDRETLRAVQCIGVPLGYD